MGVLWGSLFFLISCATSPEKNIRPEPDWLSSPPSDSGFYYGIGGSITDDEAKDRERALVRARSDLAASISVDVISVLDLKNKVDAEGISTETLESRVQQSVEQSLVNLQTVDSWYHPDRGYWVLVRMDKEEWDKQRREDRRVSIPVPSGLEELSGLNVSFLSALNNKNLPLKLLPGGKKTPYEIRLDWIVSDYPQLDDSTGIFFSKVSGTVSFKQYGLLLYSKPYGPVKDGGLNYEQARERAAQKVLLQFSGDEDFNSGIIREMGGA
jgi:hypothetical protein